MLKIINKNKLNILKKILKVLLLSLFAFSVSGSLSAENIENTESKIKIVEEKKERVSAVAISKEEQIVFLKKQISIIIKILQIKIEKIQAENELKENAQSIESYSAVISKNIFSYPFFEKDLKWKNYKAIVGKHWQRGSAKWAYDIPLASGKKILASNDGVVKFIKENSSSYGCSSKYNGKANYIVLTHNGLKKDTLYLHLKKNSMSKYKIKVGQKVKRGQVIGEVGRSGYICGEHLHFQVQKQCKSWWCDSLKVQIKK